MWKLINADSEYYRLINIFQFSAVFIFFLSNSIWGSMEEIFALFLLVLGIVIGSKVNTDSMKTKRIRLLSGLPLPIGKLSLFRYYGLVVGWLILMGSLFLSSLISRRGDHGLYYLWWVLIKIGSMFIFAGCMNLTSNLYLCTKDKSLPRALTLLIGAPVFFIAGIIGGPGLYLFTINGPDKQNGQFAAALSKMLLSSPGTLCILLIGLALLALDIYVYKQRRSYLEESILPT
jgi:hypothetical protein